jgi:putative membrane protein
MTAMLWLKAFHVIFMVTWFAGLFYLPRLFVYHAEVDNSTERQRLCVMERRLFGIMTIGAVFTAVFGLWLLGSYTWQAYSGEGWLHAKLALVVGLIGFHAWCYRLVRRFATGETPHSQRWFRFFNEVPSLFLVAIVILTVVKPF